MKRIVGITGLAGSGKDTIADFLVQEYGYRKESMAGPLKDGLAAMGFREPLHRDDKEKLVPGFNFTWRQAAQALGTEWGRNLDPDIWIKTMERRMRRADDQVVISDIRFENEAAMVRRLGGKVIHLTGRCAALGEAFKHASEAGVIFDPLNDGIFDNAGKLSDTKAQVAHYLGLPPPMSPDTGYPGMLK